MKSSDQKINNGILSNRPVYSLLAVYMPLSALVAFILIIDSIINIKLPVIIFIAAGVISSLAASVYSDFMKDVKSSRVSADVRGGIIIIIFSYIISSMFLRESSWSEKFFPNIINIPSSVFSVYIWVSVISLKQLFKARMQFEIITENFQDDELKEQLFVNPALLQYTDENIKKTKNSYFYQLNIICTLVIICALFNIHLPLSLFILLLIMLTGAVCVYGLFEIIIWEQYFAGEGLNLSAPDRIKRILAIIILTCLGLTAAILLSSDKSLIPFSLISGFFAWLFSLFPQSLAAKEDTYRNDEFLTMELPPDFNAFEEIPISPLLRLLSKYGIMIVKYGLIILGAALFIRFMISPLLKRNRINHKQTFRERLILIIIEWLKGIKETIILFFDHVRKGNSKKLKKQNIDKINSTAEILFNVYSPAKKQDIRQSITLFARLIIWGSEARDVTWKPSHAPGEYCAILAAAPALHLSAPLSASVAANARETSLQNTQDADIAKQRQNKGIIRCGEIFEKAIYSAEALSDDERKEFNDLVEEITTPS